MSSEPEQPSAPRDAKRATPKIRARQLEDLPLDAAGPEEDDAGAPPADAAE